MSSTSSTPVAAPTAIRAADLASFRETPDGNLIVHLDRFGRLTIELGDSGKSIDVYISRAKGGERGFQTFVATGVSGIAGGPDKLMEAKRANGGLEPKAIHVLCLDGELRRVDAPNTHKDRKETTGRAAAEADAATGVPEAAARAEIQQDQPVADAGESESDEPEQQQAASEVSSPASEEEVAHA